MDDGIAVVDLETGNFLDVNQKWCRMTGFSPEEARGLNVAVLCIDEPPFTGADALQWIKEASKHGPQLFEYMARTREGRRHWVEINLGRTIIGGQERLLAVVRDITERKEAEEALRISEENYRTIFNSSNDGIAAIEIETGKFLDINRRWMKITGYGKEETAELTFAPFCLDEPPFTQEDGWGWFRKATEEGPQVFEWRFKNKRGKLQLVEVDMTRTSIGGKDCILANVRDISARKRAEEELRLSEAKYRNLVEQIPAIIYVAAMDNLRLLGLFKSANQGHPGLHPGGMAGRPGDLQEPDPSRRPGPGVDGVAPQLFPGWAFYRRIPDALQERPGRLDTGRIQGGV